MDCISPIIHMSNYVWAKLIRALAKQLEAQISEVSTDKGLSVEVARATFVSHLPRAA